MGPWLVTSDEIANPDDLAVHCKVGGEVVAEDSTRYYNYKVAEVVSFISQFHTLHPGDVVSLGTAFKPGDESQVDSSGELSNRRRARRNRRIDGLGTQENPVVIEEKGARRMAARLSDLERLEIRVALEDLNTAFCYHLDHNEVDALLDLFIDDVFYTHGPPRSRGKAELEQVFRSRTASDAAHRRATCTPG